MLNFQFNGKKYEGWSVEDARAAGIPAAIIGAALKVRTHAQISQLADTYRAKLASASAGKLAEYRVKEEIARDPGAVTADELAILDREAAARGIDREAILADISAKAAAYRQIALLIGALEAEAKAAITAIADDAGDIETQIKTTLATAKDQAEQAFADAQALINGGA